MNIFPKPSEYLEKSGDFVFTDCEKLYFVLSDRFRNNAFIEKCPELWRNFTAGKSELTVVKSSRAVNTAAIVRSRDFCPPERQTSHEYELDCGEVGICITYNEENGLIHAFSSVLQLIGAYSRKDRSFTVKGCAIFDSPVLKLRGIHLCVFPETSLLFLRKAIRLCGLLKYSHVILEFWGMYRFEFMPEMSWKDGYTKAQIRALVEDGRAFGIEFIPMFNHFGHAGQSRFKAGKNVLLDNAPEYEEFFEPGGWTWNVKNPETRQLLKAVRNELAELFGAGEYFHIGCDEVFFADGRANGMDAEQNRMFVDFINSVADDLRSHGRKTIMWGDMFLSKELFPFPYCNNYSYSCYDFENNLRRLDPAICIADWQYNVGCEKDGTVEFFKKYRDSSTLLLSPWEGAGDVSAEDNINGRCSLAKKNHLPGVIATTWNTIYKNNRNLIYAACQMWSEDDGYADLCSWETYKCMAMQNLRKLLPSEGCREKSGWCVNELFTDLV